MKYCKNCGTQLLDEARFCKKCGTPAAIIRPQEAPTLTPQPAPQPVQQPAPTYPPQPMPGMPDRKNNTTKYIIIAVVILLLVGGGIVGYILWNKSKSKSGETTNDSIPAAATLPAATGESGDDLFNGELSDAAGDNAMEALEATNHAIGEMTSSSVDNIDGIVSIYHTSAFPMNNDMDWWSKDVVHHGVPKGVKRITDYSDITDGWKLMIYNDIGNKNGCENIEFCNISFAGSANQVKATIRCYATCVVETNDVSINDDLSPQDEMDFTGTFNNGKVVLNGIGNIYITDMWENNGQQFAIGRYDSPDGIPAKVALVRP